MPYKERPRGRGARPRYRPVNPAMMARVCRDLASALRTEAALGYPPIGLTSENNGFGGKDNVITRFQAAVNLDAQAARWQIEADGGPRNIIDRPLIGQE